jgi:hypothetical protein
VLRVWEHQPVPEAATLVQQTYEHLRGCQTSPMRVGRTRR